jgi:hypothetical protein
MKSFKQFKKLREQNEEQQVQQGVIDRSGVPNAVILTPTDEERQLAQNKQQSSLEEDSGWGSLEPAHTDSSPKADPSKSYREWNNSNHNSHLGESTLDVHEHLMKADPISDPHEKEHIHRYTRSSNRLNKHLYAAHLNGQKHDEVVPGNDEDYHVPAKLQNAVSKPLTHDLHVHTGLRFNPAGMSEQHPEGHVHLPAFTSTSIHAGVATSFATPQGTDHKDFHVMHIHLKPGDKARYVSGVSHFHHEKEAILPMKTTLKLHPKPDVHTDGAGFRVHVWHATVHSQE